MLHRCARRAPHRPGPSLPTKKPAARYAAGFGVDTAGSREVRFRLRDGLPASTVRCLGWNCVSCRRLLRSARSLASAGNVCWAKPNHAFFGCQQSFAKFFFGALPTRARDVPIAASIDASHACDARMHARRASPARKHWRGLQHSADARARCIDDLHSASTTRARDAHRRCAFVCRRPPDFASHKRVCAKTARTFPRALAVRARRRDVDNEKTRGVSAAGSGCSGERTKRQCSSSSSSSA